VTASKDDEFTGFTYGVRKVNVLLPTLPATEATGGPPPGRNP